MDRYLLRRIGLGGGLGVFVLFGMAIPLLRLRGDDTHLSLVMMAVGATAFGFALPRVRDTGRDDGRRGFSVIVPESPQDYAPSGPHGK